MFRGINAVNIDEKGRFAIPTRYRERFKLDCDNHTVITIDTEERCLLLYPLAAWEKIEAKLSQLPSFNAGARRIQRLLIGHATDIDIDAGGRVLLPSLLREHANIDKKLIVLGQGNKFELWDESTWQARRDSWLSEKMAGDNSLPDELQSLSL